MGMTMMLSEVNGRKARRGPQKHNAHFKLVVIGDDQVGKSTLLSSLSASPMIADGPTKLRFERQTAKASMPNRDITIHFWVLNQPILKKTEVDVSLTFHDVEYFLMTHAVIFLYDITNLGSLHALEQWMDLAKQIDDMPLRKFLYGNKCDLESQRAVSLEVAQSFAEKHKLELLEVSAKEGTNLIESLHAMVKRAFGLDDSIELPEFVNPAVAI